MKLMVLVSEAELEKAKASELDKLVDSLWLYGVSNLDKMLWRNMVERLANELTCDVVIELPAVDARTLAQLADTVCKWQPKLIPQFPISKDGLLTCKSFSSAGFRVALNVNQLWQIAISLKMKPMLLRIPTSAILEAATAISINATHLLHSVLQAIDRAYEREHPIQIILEATSPNELALAIATPANGLLMPLALLSNILS